MSIIDPRRMRAFRSAAAASWSARPGSRPRRRGPCACGRPRRRTRSSRASSRSPSSATATWSCRPRCSRRTRRRRSARRCSKRPASTGETATPATNAPLIRSGSDLILFDTGSGAGFQPTAGKLTENLRRPASIRRAITKVVFTHAHPDHIWGTIADDGALRYPERQPTTSARRNGISGRTRTCSTKMPAEMQRHRHRRAKASRRREGQGDHAEAGRRHRHRHQRARHRRPYAGPHLASRWPAARG